jgi:hypothetical protein
MILTIVAALSVLFVIGMVVPRNDDAAPPRRPKAAPPAPPSEPAPRPSASGPRRSEPQSIPVPSDPGASYQLLEWRSLPNGHREAMSRREGPSGISFARREIDCEGMRFRYLGEGDTIEEARIDRPSPEMGDLTPESISTYVSRFVCAM